MFKLMSKKIITLYAHKISLSGSMYYYIIIILKIAKKQFKNNVVDRLCHAP